MADQWYEVLSKFFLHNIYAVILTGCNDTSIFHSCGMLYFLCTSHSFDPFSLMYLFCSLILSFSGLAVLILPLWHYLLYFDMMLLFFFRFILALCPALCIYMLVCSDFAAPPQCSSTHFSRQLLLPCHYCHILLHFLVMERFLDLLEPLLPPFSHLVSSPAVWIVSFLWIPCMFVLLFVALI